MQRVRRILAIVLLVAGGVGLAGASTGWWLERYFLNTERFTGTANQLLDQQETQAALTHVLVRQLSSAAGHDLQLAEPFLATVVQQVVDSDPFRTIFDRALSAAHTVLVDRDSGQIVLDLTAAYDRIKAPLDQIAPKLAQELPSRDELRVVLLERTQLTTAWDLVDRVKGVITIATVVAVALLAAGIALSVERWRALARAGWIAVGGLAVLLLALVVTRSYIADRISDSVYARAAKSGFGVVTHGLVVQSIVVAVIAGVVAIAARWTDRHGLAAWPEAVRRGWRRLEVLVPGAGGAPAGVPASAAAGAAGLARAAGAVEAEVTGALDRVLARGGVRAQHAWRAAALLGIGLFAVLAPGGLTTVVVVLLGVGALYLALVEGLAAWRSPRPAAARPRD